MATENLEQMALFASVVDESGFSAAARKLGLTRSAVSRQIGRLEKSLGVRLLNRTTRTLSTTEAGQLFYQSCSRIAAEAQLATRAVRQLQAEPTGTLRVTGPVIGHGILVPALCSFLQRHVGLSVDLVLEDQYVNLVDEGFDLAIRIGHPTDSSLVARKLVDVQQVICGAPAYFDKHGKPTTPHALVDHEWIVYSLRASPRRLVFNDSEGRRVTVRVSGRFSINGGPAIREALIGGHGITAAPSFFVADDIAAGRLVPILQRFELQPTALYAVYPHRDLSPKVRLFIDYLVEHLAA